MTKDDLQVVFEYWIDPYMPEEYYDEEFEEKLEEEFEDFDEEELEDMLDLDELKDFLENKKINTLNTSFGVLPIDILASGKFKFWLCHTNFDITESFYYLISTIPGVESIEPMTPYRCRISIGMLFKAGHVMRNIKLAMINHEKEKRNINEAI